MNYRMKKKNICLSTILLIHLYAFIKRLTDFALNAESAADAKKFSICSYESFPA